MINKFNISSKTKDKKQRERFTGKHIFPLYSKNKRKENKIESDIFVNNYNSGESTDSYDENSSNPAVHFKNLSL